ncbi:putative transposon Ty3-I Gag-Pol polyprotein [Operophtera brumata]|uniref:Putative transposon Ty3-I Gag-Pol polyprotein n=1 Tax=Operophtera brumata TaxID=104452 RepID=A0A0L7LPT6_OPEBR|nr:putative transposon Ty3-I Gag-Pol polyprotein [Operophtera brumata]
MLTVLKYLSQFGLFLSHSSVLLQCDNRSVVAYLRNEGGSRSAELMNLTYRIFEILDRFDIHLVTHHLPGRYISVADRFSRKIYTSQMARASRVDRQGVLEVGRSGSGLFASARAHVVPRDQRDPAAWRHNAFAWEWASGLAWVFPLPKLLPRDLMHLNRARAPPSAGEWNYNKKKKEKARKLGGPDLIIMFKASKKAPGIIRVLMVLIKN